MRLLKNIIIKIYLYTLLALSPVVYKRLHISFLFKRHDAIKKI